MDAQERAQPWAATCASKVDGATSARAIMFIAFVAVAREGFETVLFLLGAETGNASGGQVMLGGLLGLAVSAVVGVLVYRFGKNIDLRKFFRITGVLLIFFAAGLVGKAVHEFRELLGLEDGWLFQPVWTITSGPLASGTLYDFLKGLFGWSSDPERIRVHRLLRLPGARCCGCSCAPTARRATATAEAPAQVASGVAGS